MDQTQKTSPLQGAVDLVVETGVMVEVDVEAMAVVVTRMSIFILIR